MGKKKSEAEPSAPPLEEVQYQQTADIPSSTYPSMNSGETTPQSPVASVTPPPTYGSTNEQPQTVNYIPQSNEMGPQSSGYSNSAPPPSYDDALQCPQYLPYGAPPKPLGPETGNPIYPPPISGSGYVIQAPSDNVGMPRPHVINTTVITNITPNSCVHCYGGEVHNETDLCCLLCLILFAILTFPMGLVLLCCIPCTTRRRCIRCRRLN